MAGLTDIVSCIQSGIAELAQMRDALTHLVPQLSSGQLTTDKLIQPGYVRVLGVSVVSGSGGQGTLHDTAALSSASTTNAVYTISNTPGFYPTNMVFTDGLAFKENTGSCVVAVFYART
jgi:hypothetical protein